MAKDVDFYLGTYTKGAAGQGILKGSLNLETGKLGPIRLAAEAADPSYVAFSADGKFLYAAQEATPNVVASYAVQADGTLRLLNQVPSEGGGACHVWVTPRHVFVSNYGGGNIACLPIQAGGSLGKAVAVVPFSGTGPNASRQGKPYAHATLTDSAAKFVYACDLGSDNVWSFAFDADRGTLQPTSPPSGRPEPGAGPRHMAWGKGERFLYVNNELSLSVTVFQRDGESGVLTPIQTLANAKPGEECVAGTTSAAILMHPNGRWLYVSNRQDDSITVFAVGGDGRLEWIEKAPAQVQIPRGFGIDPSGQWLLVAGQKDNRLTVLGIDPATGKLTPTGEQTEALSPVCVVFAPGTGKRAP